MTSAYNPQTERHKEMYSDYIIQKNESDWYRNFFLIVFVLAAGNLAWLMVGFDTVTPLYWVFNALNLILSGTAGYTGTKWYLNARKARNAKARLDIWS